MSGNSELSKTVRNIRQGLGMSYREFADHIDNLLAYNFVKYIEDDLRSPSRKKWVVFAEKFGIEEQKALDMLAAQKIHVKTKRKLQEQMRNEFKKRE